MYMQKNESRPLPHTICKNSKQTKSLNVKATRILRKYRCKFLLLYQLEHNNTDKWQTDKEERDRHRDRFILRNWPK